MTRRLKTRTPLGTTLRNDLFKELDQLVKQTKINKSILLDEAVELLLDKYCQIKKNP